MKFLFFKRKKPRDLGTDTLTDFLKKIIQNLQEGTLAENEKLELISLFIKFHNKDQVKMEEEQILNYMFIGWWVSNQNII